MSEKSAHLPEELINEILLRSPVKTVLRCKCVCKSWLSLISNPDFATSHFQLAASPTNKLVCLEKYCETVSIDLEASLNDDFAYTLLSKDFLSYGCRPIVRGSCRGFVFLQDDTNFYIWNPSTGVHKQIPESPMAIAFTDYSSRILCGFGYDPSADDYLVVLGSYNYYASYDSLIYLEIFSLRANMWKLIEVVSSQFPYRTDYEEDPRIGLLLNGAIHWLVFNHENERFVILTFDLKGMRLSEIALPYGFESVNYTSFIEYGLLVLEGLLGIFNVDMPTIDIWVMQEYPTHSSWIKTLSFSMDSFFFPVCFTNCGDIIGTDGGGGLVKFNDKGQLLEHHSYGNSLYFDCYFQTSQILIVVYTESLLSLPGGAEQS